MKRTNLENWIETIEFLPKLTREGLEELQLRRLNETLARLKARGGFYKDYPEKLESLSDLKKLPFTTARMLSDHPGKFLLTSQSEVTRVISGATSGTTGPAKRVFYTANDTEHTVGFFAAGISEMLSAGEKCLIAFPFTGPFGLGDLIAQAVERLYYQGMLRRCPRVELYEGNAEIIAQPKPDFRAEAAMVFWTVQNGMAALAESFPENVMLEEEDHGREGPFSSHHIKGT